MKLTDFYFADKHKAGTVMQIKLPNGDDSGEWLRVIGPACDEGVIAGRGYARAYQSIREELAPLDAECKEKGDWTRYNHEINWKADELNQALALDIVIDWSFDEPFSRDALAELLKQYKELGTMVAKHFQDSRESLLEK